MNKQKITSTHYCTFFLLLTICNLTSSCILYPSQTKVLWKSDGNCQKVSSYKTEISEVLARITEDEIIIKINTPNYLQDSINISAKPEFTQYTKRLFEKESVTKYTAKKKELHREIINDIKTINYDKIKIIRRVDDKNSKVDFLMFFKGTENKIATETIKNKYKNKWETYRKNRTVPLIITDIPISNPSLYEGCIRKNRKQENDIYAYVIDDYPKLITEQKNIPLENEEFTNLINNNIELQIDKLEYNTVYRHNIYTRVLGTPFAAIADIIITPFECAIYVMILYGLAQGQK